MTTISYKRQTPFQNSRRPVAQPQPAPRYRAQFHEPQFFEEEDPYEYEEESYAAVATPFQQHQIAPLPFDATQRRMAYILSTVMLLIIPFFLMLRPRNMGNESLAVGNVTAAEEVVVETIMATEEAPAGSVGGVPANPLSPVFTREVQHWAPQISQWATQYGVEPNLAAIIMQIESCGDPQAVSRAGAQGLFQVMPFHFSAGENSLDPDTNARRGLNYFAERLEQTNGDIGRAFAGYNGGHVAAASNWSSWAAETQRYYLWSTGIYNDIQSGLTTSPTLAAWLDAGGRSLCQQAAGRLGLQ